MAQACSSASGGRSTSQWSSTTQVGEVRGQLHQLPEVLIDPAARGRADEGQVALTQSDGDRGLVERVRPRGRAKTSSRTSPSCRSRTSSARSCLASASRTSTSLPWPMLTWRPGEWWMLTYQPFTGAVLVQTAASLISQSPLRPSRAQLGGWVDRLLQRPIGPRVLQRNAGQAP